MLHNRKERSQSKFNKNSFIITIYATPGKNDAHHNPSKYRTEAFQDNNVMIQPQRLDEHNQCDQSPGCREKKIGQICNTYICLSSK